MAGWGEYKLCGGWENHRHAPSNHGNSRKNTITSLKTKIATFEERIYTILYIYMYIYSKCDSMNERIK